MDPRRIDTAAWPRREAYELFRGFGFPYFSLTADVDVGPFRDVLSARGASFTVGLVYALTSAANGIAAFRQRIRGDAVVEHAVVHPSITVLADGDVFRFVTLRYDASFTAFALDAAARIERGRRADSLWSEPDRDDLLFMTALPWVSFTAMIHPVPLNPPDSAPRIAWGRYRSQGERLLMPLNVQAHHALMDGIHLGRYFEEVQRLLDAADDVFASPDDRTGTAERS